jgi:acetyltransferase-like isoleucine patch superfamily enzyme
MTAPSAPQPRGRARLFAQALYEDLVWGLWDLVVNRIAGFVLTPRVVRYAIYRTCRLGIQTPNIYPGCTFVGSGGISIGARTFVNRACYFESVAPVSIGRACEIGMQVLVVTSTHSWDHEGRFSVQPTGRAVTIGDRCWIGARAMILPGVTIGDDVVIGAGSVVTRDCASRGLYVGAPARRVRDVTPRQRA